MRSRQTEVLALLRNLKSSRIKATREFKKEAVAINGQRRSEVKGLLDQFARQRVVRRKDRTEAEAAQRDAAAAFMRI